VPTSSVSTVDLQYEHYQEDPRKSHSHIPYSLNHVQPSSLEELDVLLENALDKLVVIDFYSTNCVPCEKVAPLFLELAALEEFREKVVFVKIHVDEQPLITAKYQITGWPTFLFLRQKRVLTEIVGGTLAEATLYDWVRLFASASTKQEYDDVENKE
jgi:thioredoxin 1